MSIKILGESKCNGGQPSESSSYSPLLSPGGHQEYMVLISTVKMWKP